MSTPLRLRIAPSPTGTIHLGLARTSLFNWVQARKSGGTFVLRVEDTDRERSTPESERAILEGLAWLGLDWDEGPDKGGPYAPYRQSERYEGYEPRVTELLDKGSAYRCFCTRERLDALREEQQAAKRTPAYDRHCVDIDPAESARRAAEGETHVVRFRVPEGRTEIADLVRGDVSFDNREVDDWIMVRGDGTPTYNFVVVCDDIDMHITHVLRGEEHTVNTPKQVLLYQAFGCEEPRFGHLPLMLGKDRKKLSKRSGDTSLEDYRAAGYPRLAILNFLALQGWAIDGEREVFSLEEMVEHFEVKDVSKGGAIFDLEKFQWLAGEYLRKEPIAELVDHCLPWVIEAGFTTAADVAERRAWFEEVVEGERERIRLYAELPARIAHYFAADDGVEYDGKAEKGARKHEARVETLVAYSEWLAGRSDLADAAALGGATKAWVGERGLKIPGLFQPLRCALTGQPGGRDLFEIIGLLGEESTRARIEAGCKRLE